LIDKQGCRVRIMSTGKQIVKQNLAETLFR
jgi:hypothetical protein